MYWTSAKMLLLVDVDEYNFSNAVLSMLLFQVLANLETPKSINQLLFL